jgi:GNAT superfamily N-acetyltransferase
MKKNIKSDYHFRIAESTDSNQIWDLLKMAILRRKKDGSNQWQDGYPNMYVVEDDIRKKYGYVLAFKNEIVGYCAILINDEPEYLNIEGKWLTNNDFIVFHRLAISEKFLNIGLAKKMVSYIEQFAISKNIYSVKADTNYDNTPMLKLFNTLDYSLCGTVYIRKSPRKAFEKILLK